jgi:hypothetical protein
MTCLRDSAESYSIGGLLTDGAVRDAWSAWTDANLCAANGLPAGPFRLDVKQEMKTCK